MRVYRVLGVWGLQVRGVGLRVEGFGVWGLEFRVLVIEIEYKSQHLVRVAVRVMKDHWKQ